LSLTGVILDLQEGHTLLSTRFDALKSMYLQNHTRDRPIILHRYDIMRQRKGFEPLKDSFVGWAFSEDLFHIIDDTPFTVITALLDRKAHIEKYHWPSEPYSQVLEFLVERYSMFLRDQRALGDIMIESRNGQLDMILKEQFKAICRGQYVSKDWLSSSELKVKNKRANIAGLQLADLVAVPSRRHMICEHNGELMDSNFSGRIAKLLVEGKFRRHSYTGRIEGYGTKWFPRT